MVATVACGQPAESAGGPTAAAATQEAKSSARTSAELPDLSPARKAARSAVLITIDTLRWDAVGFMGNRRVKTPALDRLAAEGLVLEQARAHNVLTLPSHTNILTGSLPFEHGVRDNAGFVLDAAIPTLASVLDGEGFATAAVVGAFPLDGRYGLGRGFDLYDDQYPESREVAFEMPERRGDEVVSRALTWWRQHREERRLLWVHLFDPHAPYRPAEPFATDYRDAAYLGEVAAVDSYLEPLLSAIRAEQGSAKTVVAFTSDHGEGLGDHGEMTHGLFAYDSTLRVPMVIWGPGVDAGRTAHPVSHRDLTPTLLDALGVAAPPSMSGRSLLAASASPPHYFEALNASLTRDWAPLLGVVEDGFKLVELPIPELYDLHEDPNESTNLAAGSGERVAELRDVLPERAAWEPERAAVSDEEARALQALGYIVDQAPATPDREYTAADDPKNLVGIHAKIHRFIDLFRSGSPDEAIALAREVIAERPSMGFTYYQLAQALLAEERLPEALQVMNDARQRGIASERLLVQLALTLSEVGRPREGLEVLAPLAGSGDPDVLNALGLVLSEAGDQQRAKATLEQVFRFDQRNAVTHQRLALVAVRSGRWAEAEQQSLAALELDDSMSYAWNTLGVARYNTGRRDQALEAWQRALNLAPNDFDVLYNYAIVSLEAGRRDQARNALGRFVAEAPPARYGPDIERARARLRALGGR